MINFMRWRLAYLGFSASLILVGLLSLLFNGLKLSIDFTGGSLLEVGFANAEQAKMIELNQLQSAIGQTYQLSSVQAVGDQQVVLRGTPITNEQKEQVMTAIHSKYGEAKELQFATVGPTLGKELVFKTITAGGLVAILITLYVAKQFTELKYGVCAILAMLHDTLILLGSFSILGMIFGVEIDVLFVTALLTTLSFSVHDTIVVYDRIRELRRTQSHLPLNETINIAVLQTLGRSLNNSLTIIMMLAALVLLGGDTIRWFAVALLIGAITGTYSSTFTAAPLLLVWEDLQRRWVKSAGARSRKV